MYYRGCYIDRFTKTFYIISDTVTNTHYSVRFNYDKCTHKKAAGLHSAWNHDTKEIIQSPSAKALFNSVLMNIIYSR